MDSIRTPGSSAEGTIDVDSRVLAEAFLLDLDSGQSESNVWCTDVLPLFDSLGNFQMTLKLVIPTYTWECLSESWVSETWSYTGSIQYLSGKFRLGIASFSDAGSGHKSKMSSVCVLRTDAMSSNITSTSASSPNPANISNKQTLVHLNFKSGFLLARKDWQQ